MACCKCKLNEIRRLRLINQKRVDVSALRFNERRNWKDDSRIFADNYARCDLIERRIEASLRHPPHCDNRVCKLSDL